MKLKNFFGCLAILAAVAAATWNVTLSSKIESMINISLASTEALAQSEEPFNTTCKTTNYNEQSHCDDSCGWYKLMWHSIQWKCDYFGKGGSCSIGFCYTEYYCDGGVYVYSSDTDLSYSCFL